MNVDLNKLLEQEPAFRAYVLQLLGELIKGTEYNDVLKLSYTFYSANVSAEQAATMIRVANMLDKK